MREPCVYWLTGDGQIVISAVIYGVAAVLNFRALMVGPVQTWFVSSSRGALALFYCLAFVWLLVLGPNRASWSVFLVPVGWVTGALVWSYPAVFIVRKRDTVVDLRGPGVL